MALSAMQQNLDQLKLELQPYVNGTMYTGGSIDSTANRQRIHDIKRDVAAAENRITTAIKRGA